MIGGAAPPKMRPFRPEDAGALAALTRAAIRVTGAKVYSKAQVTAWASLHLGPSRFHDCAAKGGSILVAVNTADCPIAYIVMESDGHIAMLYCHPDHGGRGAGAALLARAERDARLGRIAHMFTEASELARPVFARAGFEVLHRRDFSIECLGESVPIHNFAMEKWLSDPQFA